ncbi:hypothetical protein JAK42_05880 [Stenotrophomonas maltophilia]|jgi:hypothetical protein|uniref:hypothetical protein n=1 Tax=Stenotrophomonas maltophilia TaxID=40324 RepID=UPI00128E8078|nr:hypothetical protein [Stenotrophomonas maltophilia]MCU1111850.1 hypothetical protein [Stenotrophomonas maltophilia]MCU1186742.1 hypothetical protein [Stenotrophomonas maltophilia]MDH1685298.1 hypothetical protein [Stenotrophomonas maltophilia]
MESFEFRKYVLFPFLARAFFSTILWFVVSYIVSELMPVMGVGLVDSNGSKLPIRFWEFVDKKLWILVISGACLAGLVFSFVGDFLGGSNKVFFRRGISCLKEDAISLLITFAAIFLVIFFRQLMVWKFDLIAVLGSIFNYLLALMVFNSKIKHDVDQNSQIEPKDGVSRT